MSVIPLSDEIRRDECKHGCVCPLVVRLHPSAEPLQVAGGNYAYSAFRVSRSDTILDYPTVALMARSPTRYSSSQDISRARQAFFAGNKSFLLVSERFHFFRRYAFVYKSPSYVFYHLFLTPLSRFTGTKSAGFVTSFFTVHQITPNSFPNSSLSLSSTTGSTPRMSLVVFYTPSMISSRWRGSLGPRRL